MQITAEDVRDIINGNDGNENPRVAAVTEIKSSSYSYIAFWQFYYITLIDSDRSYLLLVSPLDAVDRPLETRPITFPALSILLTKILDNTAVPLPRPVAHDMRSGEGKRHFCWLLLRVPGSSQPHPLTSLASVRQELSPTQLARVELRLGTYLRALHGITNDFFGVPMDKPAPEPPSVPSLATLFAASQSDDGEGYGEDMTPYSWQDTFVLRLEELIERVCGSTKVREVDIDINQLRHSLTRAIGSFLFDDVEMPRLIWVTGDEEDVIVSLTPTQGGRDTEADIAYILPTFGHSLWGDPLMEAWFLPTGPTAAVNEGYFDGEEDGTLIVFPRQRTKRVWYTVHLALRILLEEMLKREADEVTRTPGREKVVQWAKEILPECVQVLKDAPCY